MIHEMEHLRNQLQEDDLEFPISLSMLLFNKRAKNMSAKSIQVLTKNVRTMKKQANDNSLIIAASVYFHTHEFEEACKLLDFVVDNSAPELASLSYWIDVKSGTSRAIALKTISNTEDVSLILARAKYNSENGNFATAHDGLRDVLTKYNKFLPLLLEAAGIMMADKNWEDARSYLDRALELHPLNAQAMMMDILYDTLAGSDSIDLAKKSSELFNRFMECSHPSAPMFDKLSKMITNVLSVRCKECLDIALQCSSRAFKEQPNNVDYLGQLALVNWLIDDVATASNLFNDALSIDRSNIKCVVGSIRCLIYQGKFVEAKQQFELAEIMLEDKTTSPHFQYLQTLLYDAKSRIEIKSITDKQRFLYEQALSSCPVNGYVALDPRFLFELSQIELSKCMEHNIVMYKDSVCFFYNLILDSTFNEEDKSGCITRFLDFLEILVEIYPASLEIVSVVVRTHYSLGNICQSLVSVKHALKYHAQDPRIHICMARLYLALGNYSIALQSLEMAVGVDFCVKDNVEFNLIKACCLIKSSQNIDEVRSSLENFFHRSKLSSFSICSNWDSLSDHIHCRLLLANISNNFQTLQKYTSNSEYQFDSDFISLVMGEYMIKKKMDDEALRYFSNTSEVRNISMIMR